MFNTLQEIVASKNQIICSHIIDANAMCPLSELSKEDELELKQELIHFVGVYQDSSKSASLALLLSEQICFASVVVIRTNLLR